MPVGATHLLDALRHAGRPVPLIVLSSCAGAGGGTDGLAARLIRRGADRVIAMQASVTDRYATDLATALYTRLAYDPTQPVAAALASARYAVEQRRQAGRRAANAGPAPGEQQALLPEYGVATLFAAADDPPLVDPAQQDRPLTRPLVVPSGTSVRELGVGRLIGWRGQLRTATAVLRRHPAALTAYGVAAGVLVSGVGGIGKTALAGRITTRLRGDGWAVAVHDGRWNPNALLSAVADALDGRPEHAAAGPDLRDPAVDEPVKFDRLVQLLRSTRLLLVFDDFEQNLTVGGTDFADPTIAELMTELCSAATVGAVLLTCRYPLPDDDRLLVAVEVPPLTPSELRRLFLRLPALRDLPAEDRILVARTIGGHPRLVEFVDALLRGGRTDLRDTARKLRELSHAHHIDLHRPRSLGDTLDEAVNSAIRTADSTRLRP